MAYLRKRERSPILRLIIISIVCAIGYAHGLSAQSNTPDVGVDKAVVNLDAQIEVCRKEHHYVALGDDERRLAPNELEFRECVYRAVGDILLPAIKTESMRKAYKELVEEDKRLTADVIAGKITRGERTARIESMKAAIDRRVLEETEMARITGEWEDAARRRQYIERARQGLEMHRQIMTINGGLQPAFR